MCSPFPCPQIGTFVKPTPRGKHIFLSGGNSCIGKFPIVALKQSICISLFNDSQTAGLSEFIYDDTAVCSIAPKAISILQQPLRFVDHVWIE